MPLPRLLELQAKYRDPRWPGMTWPWDNWTPLTSVQALLTALVNFITEHSIFTALIEYIAKARGFSELKPLSHFGYCSWHAFGDPGNVTYVVVFSLMTSLAPTLMARLSAYYPSLGLRYKSDRGREKKGDIIEVILALLRCDAFLCGLFAEYACSPEGKESLQASVKVLLHLLEDACALAWHCLEFWCERHSQSWGDAAQDPRHIADCVESWQRHSPWMVPDLILELERVAKVVSIMGGPLGGRLWGCGRVSGTRLGNAPRGPGNGPSSEPLGWIWGLHCGSWRPRMRATRTGPVGGTWD